MFEVKEEKIKYQPGNPLRENLSAMGISLGSNIEILFYTYGEQEQFEIVNTKTGDTLEIRVRNIEAEAQSLWMKLSPTVQKDVLEAMKNGRKVEALKLIRAATSTGIVGARELVLSEFLAKMTANVRAMVWKDISPDQKVLDKMHADRFFGTPKKSSKPIVFKNIE